MKLICFRLGRCLVSLAILVIVIFPLAGCGLTNHPPFSTSIKAEQVTLPPSGSCQIECIASDEDGDELSYEWLASEGDIDGNGATVTWNAPESEGIYNITVRVTDGNGGEATNYITIKVGVNRPPTITSLIADEGWVTPSGSCRIECNAEDPDGDELSYEWSANGGDISGTGLAVTWTAPDRVGLCNIIVVVSDGYGGQDTRSLAISVALNPPPTIENLIVTPKEPKYLKEYSGGYKILRGKSCDIECVVTDASDELVYEWSASGGEISGVGSVVTWTAPSSKGAVTITITVSDSSGGIATNSVIFRVETCACVFN